MFRSLATSSSGFLPFPSTRSRPIWPGRYPPSPLSGLLLEPRQRGPLRDLWHTTIEVSKPWKCLLTP
jgi:hypothetical protein